MRNDITYVRHILDCIDNIRNFVKGRTYLDFQNDLMLQSAVLHQFMILGEAAGQISKKFRDEHSSIRWKLMIGTRNKLIHHYFGIDPDEVWKTVRDDLPELELLFEKEGIK